MKLCKSMGALLALGVLAPAMGCSGGASNAAADQDGAGVQGAPALTAKQVNQAITARIDKGIEGAFASRNAKTRWKGQVIHVRMDGDASKSMAGWSECRVISHVLKDGQSSVLEFPNGTLECNAVLADE